MSAAELAGGFDLPAAGDLPGHIEEHYLRRAASLPEATQQLMREPGIRSLHAVTCTNALHFEWQHCGSEETRKLLLLQSAAFLPLFRGNRLDEGARIDQLEQTPLKASGAAAIEEIFDDGQDSGNG